MLIYYLAMTSGHMRAQFFKNEYNKQGTVHMFLHYSCSKRSWRLSLGMDLCSLKYNPSLTIRYTRNIDSTAKMAKSGTRAKNVKIRICNIIE